MSLSTECRDEVRPPLALTRFIGRDSDLSEARSLVSRARLVALVGVGGVGKTRLALRLADDVRRVFRRGIWFADLSRSTAGRVAQSFWALPLHDVDAPGCHDLDALLGELGGGESLVILDNCEQAIVDVIDTVRRLLSQAPGVHVLVTSRQPLGVLGEHVFTVGPMPTPFVGRDDYTPRELELFDSVQLFADRAQMIMPGFAINTDNAPTLAAVCQRLEGIPLALELSALRLRTFSLAEVLRQLDQEPSALWRGYRDAPQRQQSMVTLCDWSYALCSEPERTLWARLQVFPGGFSLAAAREVCSGDEVRPADILELVTSLVDKSVVQCEKSNEKTRFWLHDSFRRYGAKRLDQTGETKQLEFRFVRWMLRHTHELQRGISRQGIRYDVEQIAIESRNMVAALDHLLSWRRGLQSAVRIAVLLHEFPIDARTAIAAQARLHVLLADGRAGVAQAMNHLGDAGDVYGAQRAFRRKALTAWSAGALESACRRPADGMRQSEPVLARWFAALEEVDQHIYPGATAQVLEVLDDVVQSGDRRWIASCFDILALCAAKTHDLERSARLLGYAAKLWRSLGIDPGVKGIDNAVHLECLAVLQDSQYRLSTSSAYADGRNLSGTEAGACARGDGNGLDAEEFAVVLTNRERQITELVAAGLRNRAIAETLFITERTVEDHVAHILAKLGFTRRAQIATWYASKGLRDGGHG